MSVLIRTFGVLMLVLSRTVPNNEVDEDGHKDVLSLYFRASQHEM